MNVKNVSNFLEPNILISGKCIQCKENYYLSSNNNTCEKLKIECIHGSKIFGNNKCYLFHDLENNNYFIPTNGNCGYEIEKSKENK